MTPCPVCGGNSFARLHLFDVPSRYDGKKYPLLRCRGCGLVRPFPLPYSEATKYEIYDEGGLTKCYDPKSKTIDFGSAEYSDYFKNFRFYADYIKKYHISGRHLDIGCGCGHLMRTSARFGLEPEGIELNPGISKVMVQAGFKVHNTELGDRFPEGYYDLATMNHVLEHIEGLDGFLKEVCRVLKPGAYLIMAVPYIDGLMPRLLRTYWYGHGHGQHLNMFSKKSLEMLLGRNGLLVVEMKTGSMDYAPLGFPAILRKAIDSVCAAIASAGMGDNLVVVARKGGKFKP